MGASFTVTEGNPIAWHTERLSSSTKTEIQFIIGVAWTHQHTNTIVAYTNSETAIKTICKNTQKMRNLHNCPNRVSLRLLREIIKNRKIIYTFSPSLKPYPTLQLIHVYSHEDTNEEKKKLNEKKFRLLADTIIKLNTIADLAAKQACAAPNRGHAPHYHFNNFFQIYANDLSNLSLSQLINERIKMFHLKNYEARELTKYSRWANPLNDIIATLAPVKGPSKSISCFCIRILTSSLPTKPTVRRGK